ncbi:MAG: uroporphyrinogen-III C-methyltransferase [Planctomycetota bacterium]
MPPIGRVALVGAGPGDPGLITLAGVRCLRSADVVLYDYLANAELLAHAPAQAERICLGRHGAGKLWKQSEISARMVAEALAGNSVVRLKGGDPGVFGRLAEEVAACREAGVPFQIVPGVTTAIAAGAYAGVTLTDRDRASCLTLVTGHEQPGKDAELVIDFESLAATPGTLVVYMGVTTAPEWSTRLIAGGRSTDTPVTLVRRCSLPDQSITRCTLGEVPTVLAPQRVRPPLVAIVGEVAEPTSVADWFTKRPLFGRTVLLTRPAGQADATADRLTELGARVLRQPAITIEPLDDPSALDAAIERLAAFDWVVFSSRNGVDAVMRRLAQRGRDARAFGSAKIAAVGRVTSAALADWRLTADATPASFHADALGALLAQQPAARRFLLVRASRGRAALAEMLAAAGAEVEQVVAYDSRDVPSADEVVLAELAAGGVDWIVVTSSAIARSSMRIFNDAITGAPRRPRFAAISPITAGALAEAGATADAIADPHTGEGLVAAILEAESGTAD